MRIIGAFLYLFLRRSVRRSSKCTLLPKKHSIAATREITSIRGPPPPLKFSRVSSLKFKTFILDRDLKQLGGVSKGKSPTTGGKSPLSKIRTDYQIRSKILMGRSRRSGRVQQLKRAIRSLYKTQQFQNPDLNSAMSVPTLPRVLVTSNEVPAPGINLLRTKCNVTILPVGMSTQEQVLQALPGHDAVFLLGKKHDTAIIVNKEFLDIAGPNLKVVSTMSAGYDHLDVPEIKKRGIKVGHTPMVLSAAVAEIAILLMLSAARRVHEGRIKLEQGKTSSEPQWMLGQDLRGSTVGIFGLGNIGQAIVKRLTGFEVERFIYTGHSRKKEGDELGATFVSLDVLLEQSDFLVIAAPLTNETQGLFNDNIFNKMKKTAVFVNVSRGQIVNTDSLVRALRDKKIFAAGLDVTDPEPLPPEHELLKLPNVEIMPHVGSSTIKTRNDISIIAAQNILNGLEGKPLIYSL